MPACSKQKRSDLHAAAVQAALHQASGRTDGAIDWRFVARSEKPEKLPHSPSLSRAVDTTTRSQEPMTVGLHGSDQFTQVMLLSRLLKKAWREDFGRDSLALWRFGVDGCAAAM
ncbi:hypothetical protein [Xylophilus sp.]|uniref:hypothetical protein n=1 Tax=Xylophilus sp. TaxID=2653893 RepID=UPI002D7E8E8D|nr:hypothetical protein [Xylophilus sp.]